MVCVITELVWLKPRKQPTVPISCQFHANYLHPEEDEWYRADLSECLPLLLGCWIRNISQPLGSHMPRHVQPSLPIFQKALLGSEQVENNTEKMLNLCPNKESFSLEPMKREHISVPRGLGVIIFDSGYSITVTSRVRINCWNGTLWANLWAANDIFLTRGP